MKYGSLYIFSILLFVFLGFHSNAGAQHIVINEDPAIRDLMNKYTEWNKEELSIQGWRIQIINTDDRRQMEKALVDFKENFPEVEYVRWKQISPYYKVIIGAFDSKLDVLAYLEKIKEDFPSAIPIITDINKKEVLGIK